MAFFEKNSWLHMERYLGSPKHTLKGIAWKLELIIRFIKDPINGFQTQPPWHHQTFLITCTIKPHLKVSDHIISHPSLHWDIDHICHRWPTEVANCNISITHHDDRISWWNGFHKSQFPSTQNTCIPFHFTNSSTKWTHRRMSNPLDVQWVNHRKTKGHICFHYPYPIMIWPVPSTYARKVATFLNGSINDKPLHSGCQTVLHCIFLPQLWKTLSAYTFMETLESP